MEKEREKEEVNARLLGEEDLDKVQGGVGMAGISGFEPEGRQLVKPIVVILDKPDTND